MNSYLLLYKEPKHFGRFANFANVNCLALGIHLGFLPFWWLSLYRFSFHGFLSGYMAWEHLRRHLSSFYPRRACLVLTRSQLVFSGRILEILALLPWWLANLITAGSISPLVEEKRILHLGHTGHSFRGKSS